MINIDRMHLSCLTAGGYGLRETLFYGLFSRMQIYETRAHMQDALPFISDGAISLDGGIMKDGLFFLGDRQASRYLSLRTNLCNSLVSLLFCSFFFPWV